jgi:NADPH-dependent 2,4-dienoyl-CoA reductase/sulfur reductase-like enzyme
MNRRDVLTQLCAGGALSLAGCAHTPSSRAPPRVVVVGGGFGGTTAAKYLRLFSADGVEVTLVEPNPRFVSSPLSNRVIAGEMNLSELSVDYDRLRSRHGVSLVRDRVTAIDARGKFVSLAGGVRLRYDKLVLSPGIEPIVAPVEGLAAAYQSGRIVFAWNGGAETVALRRQLEAMPDGGVFVITIPESPYRCPPAPYERASLVAAYLQAHKPRSKVLVLDANQDVTAMGPLFKSAWRELYGDLIEYRNHYSVVGVDGATLTLRFDVQEDVHADVINLLPPVRAAALAVDAGLANVNGRWCEVDFLNFESRVAADVHVLGDSIQAAPMMPKSGFMANAHAKVAASAIVAQLQGEAPNSQPMLANTCYAFVSASQAMHAAAVYRFVAAQQRFEPIPGSGGASAKWSELEARYAMSWARNIWSDMLG